MQGLTTKEAADRLGISPSTLRHWMTNFSVDVEIDERGHRRLDEKALAVLQTVKELRGEDCGFQTIRRRMQPGELTVETLEAVEAEAEITQALDAALARIANLEATLQIREAECVRLNGELALTKARLAAVVDAAPAKPWWKLWG